MVLSSDSISGYNQPRTCLLLWLHFCVSFSDTLYSTIVPLEPARFDASLLGEIAYNSLSDLLVLSGLQPIESEETFSEDSIRELDTSLTDFGVKDKDVTAPSETSLGRCFKKPTGREKDQVIESELTGNEMFDRSKSFQGCVPNKTGCNDPIQAQSFHPLTTENSCQPDAARFIDPVLKMSALKSLSVLLGSNTLLRTLTADVYNENSPPDEDLSQKRLNCVQTLLKSMVSHTVLPSPFRRIVTLMDLERAQSVLTRQLPSRNSSKQSTISSKASLEGTFKIDNVFH